jgi:hypothetical protein
MVVTLPKLRCLTDEPDLLKSTDSPQPNGRPQVRQESFVFDPGPDDPDRTGIMFGLLDRHDIPLTAPTLVPADSKLADRVFTRGEIIVVSADNPRLMHFVKGNRMFRAAKYWELNSE